MSAPAAVELLLFEVDRQPFAADVTLVERISREPAATHPALGAAGPRHRSLEVRLGGHLRRLGVDHIQGVRRVDALELRRMPQATGAPALLSGVWLGPAAPVLLVDLSRLSHD